MPKLQTLIAAVIGLSLAQATRCEAQGVIRIALGTTLSQIDPAKTTIGDEYVYVHLVFNGLSRIDSDMTVKPDFGDAASILWGLAGVLVAAGLVYWRYRVALAAGPPGGAPAPAEQ